MIPSGRCQCGCGEETGIATRSRHTRGIVKGQPLNFLPGHGRCLGPEYRVEDCGYQTPCWVWTRYVAPSGYGRAGSRAAHRVIYERRRGAIPAGLDLDHLCRNTRCVNPDHLEPVTEADNVRRGRSAKLDWRRVREIRSQLDAGRLCKDIAAQFGVHPGLISQIKRGLVWRES